MENNIISLNPSKRATHKTNYIVKEKKEVEKMSTNDYVTKEQLSNLEEKIDLKIQSAVQPIEYKIENLSNQIDSKFEIFEQKIENLFLKQKEEIQKERKENIKWIVGTAIGLAATVATLVSIL